MRALIKPTLYSFIAVSLLSGCGEESLYDKEVPMISADDYARYNRAERKEAYSKTFKKVQEFVNKYEDELGSKDTDKLRTTLIRRAFTGKLPEGTTVGDILGKKE